MRKNLCQKRSLESSIRCGSLSWRVWVLFAHTRENQHLAAAASRGKTGENQWNATTERGEKKCGKTGITRIIKLNFNQTKNSKNFIYFISYLIWKGMLLRSDRTFCVLDGQNCIFHVSHFPPFRVYWFSIFSVNCCTFRNSDTKSCSISSRIRSATSDG